MMQSAYKPYFDPEFETLIERIHPPSVTIDNDTCDDCTLIKVDSKNWHGILLEMVQVLTDIDLIISKSYISSDGGWLMDVFHVTDQLGNKLTDENIIHYIQQALCAGRRSKAKPRPVGPTHIPTTDEQLTILEMTSEDRHGLLSEISAVLIDLNCYVVSAAAWTHNGRAACIIYVKDECEGGGQITDPVRLANVEEQLANVVGAHHALGEKRKVCLIGTAAGRTHTERRLHQLMYEDRDYDRCSANEEVEEERKQSSRIKKGSSRRCCGEIQVEIETCDEKAYSVVNIISRDRPKLLFDTVCTLTDLQYVVFHAAISSKGSLATQEYYIRHKDGCTMDTEGERQRVIQCIVAAVERRVSHGLRLDVSTRNRVGLLSDITRVFRENALSVSMAEIGTRGEQAIGSFYVTDSSGNRVDPRIVEVVQQEIGGSAVVVHKSPSRGSQRLSTSGSSSSVRNNGPARSSSLGSLLWAQIERFSGNFGSIKS